MKTHFPCLPSCDKPPTETFFPVSDSILRKHPQIPPQAFATALRDPCQCPPAQEASARAHAIPRTCGYMVTATKSHHRHTRAIFFLAGKQQIRSLSWWQQDSSGNLLLSHLLPLACTCFSAIWPAPLSIYYLGAMCHAQKAQEPALSLPSPVQAHLFSQPQGAQQLLWRGKARSCSRQGRRSKGRMRHSPLASAGNAPCPGARREAGPSV